MNTKAHTEVEQASLRFLDGDTTIQEKTADGLATTRKTDLLCFETDPEIKRRIIGDTFMEVAKKVIARLNLKSSEVFLGQGTLRPDLIESASGLASEKADLIKTHHNDTDLVRKLRNEGRVVEPLTEFHKDEVRILGEQLGLPSELVHRHPFPGPGLAIRIICQKEPHMEKDFSETQVLCKLVVNYGELVEKTLIQQNQVEVPAESKPFLDQARKLIWVDVALLGVIMISAGIFILGVLNRNKTFMKQWFVIVPFGLLVLTGLEHALLNRVDSITTIEERAKLGEISKKQKYLSTLLPIRTVGVQGDGRTYSYAVGLSSEKEPVWEDLLYFARIILRLCHNVNRICYVFGGPVEHPVTDITPTTLTNHVIGTLRLVDYLANQTLFMNQAANKVSQMPLTQEIFSMISRDFDPSTAFYVSLVCCITTFVYLIVTLLIFHGTRKQRSIEFIPWLIFTPIVLGVLNVRSFLAVHGFWGFDELERPDSWEFLTIEWDIDVIGTLLLDCVTTVTFIYAWRSFKRLRTKEIQILMANNRWQRHSV
ncbi:hypothetical protein TCAL_17083 [Tigriopus californicus]|uniref:GMPS ATP-PPase domain-containing protein n=1 Tax=Tigriopus californicus TaxID=6832 RepID=A0A553PP96_TIGCA|nr:hypothetical protein TCAL_17083 [Tigriopus californicus]